MSSPFGAVQYDDPQAATAPEGSAPTNDQVSSEVIDLNDPALVSEAITINPEGDSYARMPSLPDGKYRAKLRQKDLKDAKGQMVRVRANKTKKDPIYLYLATAVEAEIIDLKGEQKWDGVKITDNWVSTMTSRDGSTAATTIAYMAGKPAPKSGTHKAMMDHLLAVLATEPEVGIQTEWEWDCLKCGEEADKKHESRPRSIRGMQRFPQNPDGSHNPELVCPVNKAHGPSRARPRIVGYLKVSDLPKQG